MLTHFVPAKAQARKKVASQESAVALKTIMWFIRIQKWEMEFSVCAQLSELTRGLPVTEEDVASESFPSVKMQCRAPSPN